MSRFGCVSEFSPAPNTSIWSLLSPSISHNPPAQREWDMRWNTGWNLPPLRTFQTPFLLSHTFPRILSPPPWCRKKCRRTLFNCAPLPNIFTGCWHVGFWLAEGERCLRLMEVWHAAALSTSLASSLPKTHNCRAFCGLYSTLTHPHCCAAVGRAAAFASFRTRLNISVTDLLVWLCKRQSNSNKEFKENLFLYH